MDPATTCNTSGKYVEDRNSIKCNLKKVYLRYNHLNSVESQYIKFSKKLHCYNCSRKLFPFTTKSSSLAKVAVIIIQIIHAKH